MPSWNSLPRSSHSHISQNLHLTMLSPVLVKGKLSRWTAQFQKATAYSYRIFFVPGGSEGKVSACNVGDLGWIPGLGRSPGEGNGSPLHYSCLENPMEGGAW